MIDFAIVGQPKSGTTALAHFLGSHPELCMAVPKEPHYFASDLIASSDRLYGKPRYFDFRSVEAYAALFSGCAPRCLRGEASTGYLLSTQAADNIRRANPAARIVIMLREPVEFMQALHQQHLNDTIETERHFGAALELEPRRREGLSIPSRARAPELLWYRHRARYTEQVQRYLSVFPREQILVIAAERFADDNAGVYREILRFLGVSPGHIPSFPQVNVSAAPRWSRLNTLAQAPTLRRAAFAVLGPQRFDRVRLAALRVLLRPEPRRPLPPDLERTLRAEMADEVRALSRLLDQDFAKLWGY